MRQPAEVTKTATGFWRKAFSKTLGKTLGLTPRVMILSVSGILVLGLCITSVANYVLERNAIQVARDQVDMNMRVAWDVIRSKGKVFSVVDGKLMADGHVLNGDEATVDRIKGLVGGTCTLFLGDLRVATNVMKPDGTRAVGTKLARSEAYASVIEQKTPFRGEVTILDEPYMTAYDPILGARGELLGILYVGLKKAEFLKPARDTFWTIIYSTLGVTLLAMVVSYFAARKSIVDPLKASIATMNRLAQGDLSTDTPMPNRTDEIGEIMTALTVFKTNALEMERLKSQQQESQSQTAAQRKADLNKLADDFESAVGEIIQTVSRASSELETSASSMSSNAERSERLATHVAAASEEASTNVHSVAAAAEEMASSVNEIGRQVQESARIANEAVEQAGKTNARVSELAQAALRIGDVVELINSIAGQTNLLALNATIEAARAGEAGRGFAVVASEVKALASQTAKATDEIGQQINGIQAATQESVGAIKEIGDTIGRMSDISAAIASAVAQQGEATQEISRNVQQAARGTTEVSANIGDVQRGASETGSASTHVLAAAQSLSRDSTRLKNEVGKFLDTVRVA